MGNMACRQKRSKEKLAESLDVEIPEDPPSMDKKTVKKIGEDILHVSQPIFAKYLGVSDKAVKAWEQGLSKPNGSAVRAFADCSRGTLGVSKYYTGSGKKGA